MVSPHSNVHRMPPRLRLVPDVRLRRYVISGPTAAFTPGEDKSPDAAASGPAGE